MTLTPQPTEWARVDWLEWRQDHIGASEVGAVLGWSRWSSPMALYMRKRGLLDVTDDGANEQMQIGLALEPALAELFHTRTGLYVVGQQLLVTNDEWPWLGATLDGLAVESPVSTFDAAVGTVQMKVTSDFSWDDAIPDDVQVQVQTEMGLTGHRVAFLPVLHAGRRFSVYEVEFDPLAFVAITKATRRFWYDQVVAETPPPVDAHDATGEAIRDAYRHSAQVGDAVDLDAELVAAWLPARAAVDAAEDRLAVIENRIRLALGDATVGRAGGLDVVTCRPQATAARFDRKRFEADYPELHAEYIGEKGTTRVLRPTKALKGDQ